MNAMKMYEQGGCNQALFKKPNVFSIDLWLHGCRVAEYAMILLQCAQRHGLFGDDVCLNGEQTTHLGLAMRYHDAGKLATPHKVLHKAGKLNQDEWNIMRRHPYQGTQIFGDLHGGNVSPVWWPMYRDVIMQHHERWDGEGYPQRRKGKAISLWARLCAVADAYDAITHSRVYHAAASHEHAYHVIVAQSGAQFDPRWVLAFQLCEKQLAGLHQQWKTA